MENQFDNQDNVQNQQNSYGQQGTYNNTNPYGQQNAYDGNINEQNTYGYAQQNAYNAGYGYNQGGNYGGPVDKNGCSLPNNFGMKLTFSILEMITIMFCNVITLVMGILGCVFTCKANNAYKEGRWSDFSSAKKTSNVFLWIGFAVSMVYLVLIIVTCVAIGAFSAGITREIMEHPERFEEYLERSQDDQESLEEYLKRMQEYDFDEDDWDDFEKELEKERMEEYQESQDGANFELPEGESDQTNPFTPLQVYVQAM